MVRVSLLAVRISWTICSPSTPSVGVAARPPLGAGNSTQLHTERGGWKLLDASDHSIEGFGHPLTMVYLPESDRLVVTNGDTDDVALVDCKEYKIINTLKLGKGVDHSAFNPVNKYFYVENGATPDGKSHSLLE
jgi:DNA-binding beta-propeller fold protein YncE